MTSFSFRRAVSRRGPELPFVRGRLTWLGAGLIPVALFAFGLLAVTGCGPAPAPASSGDVGTPLAAGNTDPATDTDASSVPNGDPDQGEPSAPAGDPGDSGDEGDPGKGDPGKGDPGKGDPGKGETDKGDAGTDGDADAGDSDKADGGDGDKEEGGEGDGEQTRFKPVPEDPDHPYPVRFSIPDFPKDAEWYNTGGPLRKRDLKGKFVLIDFWTYCCINCIHILPELKKLEKKYPKELVVIGVHSAKFDTEKKGQNIREAILRYEIEHPVVNDPEHRIWQRFEASSWPSIYLVDPEGNAVWLRRGEIKAEDVELVMKRGLQHYRDKKLLDETPIHFNLLAHQQEVTPLRFPGKVLADEAGGRLFITDSNHNRIVITSLDGKLQDIIGTGAIGADDGGYDKCSFDHPQGVALHGQTLYVSDTENHLLRKIDLAKKQVTTIAGRGGQARTPWPGLEKLGPADPLPDRWVGKPLETSINSPWALWVQGEDLFIAMAGPHQIWKMKLDESEIGPYAGNGREDIVDGPLMPKQPYQTGFSSFAQPSGLAGDGEWLYVADSEGSSIRAVPFDPTKEVRTVVGTAELPYGRLFEFGDKDGERKDVKLQHALGVVHREGTLYIADTYNNKIKAIDAKTGKTRTIAGTGEPGKADDPPQFDEPAGLSLAKGTLYVADTNNHLIRTINVKTGVVGTLAIDGLTAPQKKAGPRKPKFTGAAQVKLDPAELKPTDNGVKFAVKLKLPTGWKINDMAPMSYWLDVNGEKEGAVDRKKLGRTKLKKPAASFAVPVALTGEGSDEVTVSLRYYYCQEGGEGLCKVGSVVFTVPLKVSAGAKATQVELIHQVR